MLYKMLRRTPANFQRQQSDKASISIRNMQSPGPLIAFESLALMEK